MKVTIIPKNSVSIEEDFLKAFSLLSEGYTVKEAATDLGLNVRTLEARVINLRKELGCKNVVHLIADLIRAGLI